MRTLSSTLTAMQKTLQGMAPVIKLEVSDRPVEVPRFDWAVVSSEAISSCHGAACLTNTGAVVRIRVKTDGTLQVQRKTAPATDDWSTWTDLGTGYSTAGQCAVGADPDSANVMIGYVSRDGLTLHVRHSTDGGVTWGPEAVIQTVVAPASVKGVGIGTAGGQLHWAWTVDSGAAEPNDTLSVDRYLVGVGWTGIVADGVTYESMHGVGVAVVSGVTRVVLGGDRGLKRRDYSWATGWATAVTLIDLPSGSGFSILYPRVFYSPDGSGRWFYSFLEYWTVDVLGQRQWLYCTVNKDELLEGLVMDTNRGKGWDLLYTAGYWYMVCSVTHYRSVPYSGSATQKADLGADVVAFDIHEAGANRATRGRIWLLNRDGRYATPGSGTYAMIREGSRVCLGLGYRTSAGQESVWLPPLWVEYWTHEESEGEAYLVLEVGDAWRYLDRCLVRYQVSYSGLTFGQVVERLLYRVSSTALSAVGGLTITANPFTLKPGESIGAVVRRVCDKAGVLLRFGTTAVGSDPGHWDACVPSAQVKGTGSSGYSFGPASHKVLRGEYENRRQPYNLVEIYGKGYWDYRKDSQHIHDSGHVYALKEADWLLDSQADVGDRRDRQHYNSQAKLVGGELEVLPHLGAELYDVVDVTATRAGLSGAVRRVAGIRWRYDGRKGGIWTQRLELGAV